MTFGRVARVTSRIEQKRGRFSPKNSSQKQNNSGNDQQKLSASLNWQPLWNLTNVFKWFSWKMRLYIYIVQLHIAIQHIPFTQTKSVKCYGKQIECNCVENQLLLHLFPLPHFLSHSIRQICAHTQPRTFASSFVHIIGIGVVVALFLPRSNTWKMCQKIYFESIRFPYPPPPFLYSSCSSFFQLAAVI